MINYFARKRMIKAGRFWSKAIDDHIALYRLNACVVRVEALVRCKMHLQEVQKGLREIQRSCDRMVQLIDGTRERGVSLPPYDNLHVEVYD